MTALQELQFKVSEAHHTYMDAMKDSVDEIQSITYTVRENNSHRKVAPNFKEPNELFNWLKNKPNLFNEQDGKYGVVREVFLK
ncbi:hypothetical protein [Marinomonas sp.]|uniref:hypothetical protein n=1 Tax=Marinomonas sp. TaxID=1904862 RepID=UPI003A8CF3D8